MSWAMQDISDRKDRDEEEDMKPIKRAVAILSEHYDTVQIFVTRVLSTGETVTIQRGEGNYWARKGQPEAWVRKEAAYEDGVQYLRAKEDQE